MRVSLVPGLLETARHNLNRGARDLAVYEMSKIYPVTGEIEQLAMLSTGSAFAPTVHRESQPVDFFTLKGDVEAVLAAFECDTTPSTDGAPTYFHPGRSVRLGEVAVLGELTDSVTESYKIRQRLYVAEIDVDKLLSAGSSPIASGRIPKFPSVRRDLSLLIRRDVTYGDVVSAVRKASIGELIDMFPFDKLEKGAFPADRYSLAVALTFQADDRTLTDAEVEEFERRVLGKLEQIGIALRS
jgi:phenylalanyl-tRNA synthetase beta chain